MEYTDITRRKLLAGVGSVGVASAGGLTLFTESAKAFPNSMDVSGPVDLQLEWRETYNGAVVEDSTAGATEPTPDGPVLSLQNVLPGDSGTLSVRLSLVEDGEVDDGAETFLSLSLTGRAENGFAGPEADAGDDDTDGELQEFLDVGLWYDSGVLGLDAFGGENAVQEFGEDLVHPDAEGTLGAVDAALPERVQLDPAEGSGGVSVCLSPGDSITITFGWEFDPDNGDVNVTQGDAVSFDLGFVAESCGETDGS